MSTTISQRERKTGQVPTPEAVALWMAQWIAPIRPTRVWDPCVGDGRLLAAALDSSPESQCLGWDTDAAMLDAARRRLIVISPPSSHRIELNDFLQHQPIPRAEAILANPPYVRAREHKMAPDQRRQWEEWTGVRLPANTNLYAWFIIGIALSLVPGGRAAILVPAEAIEANFSKALRGFLLGRGGLTGVLAIPAGQQIFEGVQSTACLLLIEQGPPPAVLWWNPAASPDAALLDGAVAIPREQWNPDLKRYGLAGARINGTPTLGDFFTCRRGLATGANRYFVLALAAIKRLGLPPEAFRLCIASGRQVGNEPSLTAQMLEELQTRNAPVSLLDSPPEVASRHRVLGDYLEEGRRQGIPNGYLASKRKCWHEMEAHKVAPLWVRTFYRDQGHFMVNEAGAVNLTAFHGLHPRRPMTVETLRRLADWLNGTVEGQRSIRAASRQMAGGLMKIEPRDVLEIAIPGGILPSA